MKISVNQYVDLASLVVIDFDDPALLANGIALFSGQLGIHVMSYELSIDLVAEL